MDSFGTAAELRVGDRRYAMYRLAALERHGFEISRLPYSLRILLENLLRNENSSSVTRDDIEALAGWKPGSPNAPRSRFSPPAFCCRISLAFPRSSISRRCATPWSGSAAIRPKSIRYSRSNW